MVSPPAPPPLDLCTLTDFALGRLSAEASSRVISELERNPQASRDLEAILKIIAHFEHPLRDISSTRDGQE
jgi:anti-sigma factor RsiW